MNLLSKGAGHVCTLVMTAIGSAAVQGAESPTKIPATEVEHVVELTASADADVQGGAPNANYGDHTVLHVGTSDKSVFVAFDLSSLPEGALIRRAHLVLTVAGTGEEPNEVKLGAVQQPWQEQRITFANQPRIAWSQRVRKLSAPGPVRWDVTKRVRGWHATSKHNGFAVRSTGPGPIWAFVSREGAPIDARPRLRVKYTLAGAPVDAPVLGQAN